MKIYIYKVNSIEEISSNTRWKVLRNNLGYCCLLDGDIMCVFDYYKSFIIFREMEKHNLRCSTYKELDDNIYYEGDDFVFVCRYSDERNMYDKRCWLQKGNDIYDITKGLNEYNNLYNWYEYAVSDLKPNTKYQIMKFEKTKNGNVVISICNGYYHPIYVNNKVMNILEKYFETNIPVKTNMKEMIKDRFVNLFGDLKYSNFFSMLSLFIIFTYFLLLH